MLKAWLFAAVGLATPGFPIPADITSVVDLSADRGGFLLADDLQTAVELVRASDPRSSRARRTPGRESSSCTATR